MMKYVPPSPDGRRPPAEPAEHGPSSADHGPPDHGPPPDRRAPGGARAPQANRALRAGRAPLADLAPLAGFTVAVTAARRADEIGGLLERRGAAVLHAPALRIVPLADDTDLHSATLDLIGAPPDT